MNTLRGLQGRMGPPNDVPAEVVKAFNYTNYELVNKKVPPFCGSRNDGWWEPAGTRKWLSVYLGMG